MDSMVFPIITETEYKLPLHLVSVGHWDRQERMVRPEGYPYYQWLQCSGGEGELLLEGKKYTVGAKQGFFLLPHVPHEYYPTEEYWGIDWMAFDGRQIGAFIDIPEIGGSGVYSIKNYDAIHLQLRNLLSIAQSNSLMKGFECSKAVYSILVDLMRYITVSSLTVQQQYSRLQPVLEYMDANYDRVITLEALAAEIGVTPQHLCLLFKRTLKMRPFEYLNILRINKSKMLMFDDSGKKINEIAGLVGFDSPSYFGSVFKRIEGISPESFKRLHAI